MVMTVFNKLITLVTGLKLCYVAFCIRVLKLEYFTIF